MVNVWKCQCCPPEIVKMSKKTRGRKWINDKQQDEREKQSNSQSKEFANLLQSLVGTSSLLWITETYLIETVKHICCPFPPASIHCLMGIFLQEFQQSFLSGVPKEDEEQSVNKDLCEQSLFITGWFMVRDYNMWAARKGWKSSQNSFGKILKIIWRRQRVCMVMCMKGASKLPPSTDLNLGSCAGAASLLGMQTPVKWLHSCWTWDCGMSRDTGWVWSSAAVLCWAVMCSCLRALRSPRLCQLNCLGISSWLTGTVQGMIPNGHWGKAGGAREEGLQVHS